jgi:hypothetical protein
MSEWQPIETAPKNGTPFLAAESEKKGRQTGGVLVRAAQTYPHKFEQKVDGGWHPAFIAPKVWSRERPSNKRAANDEDKGRKAK